jgi:hypothetical protein
MIVKHYAQGKFYRIACPEGSRIIRRSDRAGTEKAILHDVLVVPFEGEEIPIPADPPGLLPLLAESGRCGLSLVREPELDRGPAWRSSRRGSTRRPRAYQNELSEWIISSASTSGRP